MKETYKTVVIVLMTVIVTINTSISSGDESSFIVDNTKVAQCKALARTDFSGIPDAPTQLTLSNFVDENTDLPAYCQVRGYVAPSVGFELRMPSDWNGKFLQVGCGAHCGIVLTQNCNDGLRKGYACLASDMGHKGTGVDGLWGYNNLQAKLDWGFRATHVVTVAGKAIVGQYYTQSPNKSYFVGCSTGGRQALQEAQRFPWDFDGIIAGAPPVNLTTLYMTLAWGIRATRDKVGNALLDKDDLKLLTASAVAQCDLDDGIKDDIIGDPLHCAFDPSELVCKSGQFTDQCLTAEQIDAVKKVYAGPMTSKGVKLSPGGPVFGSEYGHWMGQQYDWREAYLDDGKPWISYEKIVTNGFRYLFFFPEPGPTWNLRDFDFDHDYKRLGLMQAMYDSSNPDLRKFKAAGGKLIIHQGMNDFSVLPRSTIDYYEAVERTIGGSAETQDFARLFLLPGVSHCRGGSGAYSVDYLSYLEAWVEKGKAPDKLISSHIQFNDLDLDKVDDILVANKRLKYPLDPTAVEFTRPVYPYPLRAKYLGNGNPKDAENFGPVRSGVEVMTNNRHKN